MIAFVYNNERQQADVLRPTGRNILCSSHYALETAVLISLFTDARAKADEVPTTTTDLRGYWGDTYADEPIGSKLWLLMRDGTNAVSRAKRYAEEALAWMTRRGVARQVSVTVTEIDRGVLLLAVGIERPNQMGRWANTWKVQYAK